MEFGTFSFTILGGGINNFFRAPKNTHTNNFGGDIKFLDPPKIYLFTNQT